MRNVALLAVVVFAVRLSLSAQAGDPGADKVQAPSNVPGTLNSCLQREGFQYTLIDQTGKSLRLTGNTGKLSHLAGHQVQITGKPTIKTSDTTQALAASAVEEVPASGEQQGGLLIMLRHGNHSRSLFKLAKAWLPFTALVCSSVGRMHSQVFHWPQTRTNAGGTLVMYQPQGACDFSSIETRQLGVSPVASDRKGLKLS